MPKVYAIAEDLSITLYPTLGEAEAASEPGTVYFRSEFELKNKTGKWPTSRLVDLRNSIPGLERISRNGFKSKEVALQAIWRAIQDLQVVEAKKPEPKDIPLPKVTVKRSTVAHPHDGVLHYYLKGLNPFREGTKSAALFEACSRPQGATQQELEHISGWSAHCVRGWISTNSCVRHRKQEARNAA